jgi:magnesium transporter
MRLFAYGPETLVERQVTDEQGLDEAEGAVVRWLDVAGLGSTELLQSLAARFGLHPLAVEDVFDTDQRPKFESYPNHDFLVFRQLSFKDRFDIEQVSMFIGDGFVITVQEHTGDSFEPVRDRIRRSSGRIRSRGADYLAYALLDAAVDHYFPVLEQFGEKLEAIEEQILVGRGNRVLLDVHGHRRGLHAVRRSLTPLREALRNLLEPDGSKFLEETRFFLRDTLDHAMQAMEMVESFRDHSASLMELNASQDSQRMNEIMKVLTIISTLFIPLSFIAAVYGMNFDTSSPYNMPELSQRYGYPVVLGGMVLVDLCFLVYFWRQGWISLSVAGRKTVENGQPSSDGASASPGGHKAETG